MIDEGQSDLDYDGIKSELSSMEYLPVNLLKAAEILGVNVVSSSPFMSGFLLQQKLPRENFKCVNNSARHLLLLRSIPSSSLLSTVVGMKSPGSVEQNLEYLYHENLTEDEFYHYVSNFKVSSEEFQAKNPSQGGNGDGLSGLN